MAQLNHEQYERLERAVTRGERIVVSRRGTEYVLIPLALQNTEDAYALYDEIPFGLEKDDIQQYATDKGMRRFGTISGALGRPVEEIDLDYSPLQLEDTFASEDQKVFAALA